MLAVLGLTGVAACGMARGEEPDANTRDAAPGLAAALTPPTSSLPVGTTIEVTLDETVSSRRNEAGETVTTTLGSDLKDAAGRVVMPAGSVLELRIVEITPATNTSQDYGTLVLQVTSVWVRDRSYPLSGEITSLVHTREVTGRIIGESTTGTIIGGPIRVVGGTVHTAGRDVVVIAGTPLGITLTRHLDLASP